MDVARKSSRTTLREVARRAGVSISTISCVINRTKAVRPETAARVQEAIQELNYQPDTFARGLRTKQSNTIGLVVSDITNLFFPDIARGVEDRAERDGFSVFLCNTDADPRREERYIQTLLSRRVDGIIFTSMRQDDHGVRNLWEDGFPIVLINRGVIGLDVDYVGSDNFGGAVRAVEYLIGLGHRRIAFIGGAHMSTASADRRKGYEAAMAKHGINYNPGVVLEGSLKHEGGYAAARVLFNLPEPPTAIFAANDLMAFGVMDAAAGMGIRIPEDVSLIGFDDIKISSFSRIHLTTVRQARYEMGQIAAEMIIDKICSKGGGVPHPRQVILPCELVVRSTTASPKQSS